MKSLLWYSSWPLRLVGSLAWATAVLATCPRCHGPRQCWQHRAGPPGWLRLRG